MRCIGLTPSKTAINKLRNKIPPVCNFNTLISAREIKRNWKTRYGEIYTGIYHLLPGLKKDYIGCPRG